MHIGIVGADDPPGDGSLLKLLTFGAAIFPALRTHQLIRMEQ